MHELSLADEIHRMCRDRMDGAAGRLERVCLAVGELAAVEPDLLRFAWEAVIAGGPDEGAVLEIEWRDARQTCEACGEAAKRGKLDWPGACLHCGGALSITGGMELDLLKFEYQPASVE
jgi:hydrogenase nickel insertion protein HypA